MATDSAQITAQQLRELTRQLDWKTLRYAVKNVMQAEARVLRRTALNCMTKALGSKVVRGKNGLGKNIKAGVSKDGNVAYARVSTHGKAYMHTNRRGKSKPIAFWLNSGTNDRATKGSGTNRKAHGTGRIVGKGFIEEAERKCLAGVNARLDAGFYTAIEKKAKKLGLI